MFTGIKTERWKVTEVSKIACLGQLGLKQVGKIVCVGIKTSKKYGLCWIWSKENECESWNIKVTGERLFMEGLKQERNIVCAGIEARNKDCLCMVEAGKKECLCKGLSFV